MNKIKIGLVGCGRVAEHYNFILKKLEIKNYEIIVVSNGSTDNTHQEVKKIKKKYKYIKYFFVNKASRGVAIKLGIKKSKKNLIALCAIDNAWDLNFYIKSYKVIKNSNFDVIFGPKTHLNSKVNRPIIRKIISLICTTYLKLLFGNKIDQDTQCIKIFNKKRLKCLKYLSDRNLFFDAEFFILTKLFKLNYLSIPVRVDDNKNMVSLKMMLFFVLDAFTFRFSKSYKKAILVSKKK